MYSKTNSAFNEINISLNNVYKHLNNPKTEEQGNKLFKNLISKYLFQNTLIFSIINSLEEKIMKSTSFETTKYVNLLSYFFEKNSYNSSFQIYLSYLNPVLSIIQSLIIEKNIDFLNKIPELFTKIVHNLTPDDINASNKLLTDDEIKIYEILQNFCFYNLKFSEKINQIIGSLCLTKLVENCPYVLKNEYMKIIIDNILSLLSLEDFKAKHELLNCLISLILGAENLFMPYANETLYKVLDFLSDDDSNKRKLALNVIYTLIFYCKEQILPLKEHIVGFLRELKTDKVKDVREVCLLILQIFNENEPKKKEKEKSIGAIINTKNKGNKTMGNFGKKESGEINSKQNNKTKNKSRPKTGNKMKKNNKFFENNKKFEKNPFKDDSFDNTNYNKKPTNNINTNINTNENQTLENNINTTKPSIVQKKNSNETNTNTVGTGIVSGNSSTQNKFKGQKANNFVNEKMVIKPDPNKSIFKAVPNSAFFNQGNQKNTDIVVIAKKRPTKTNENKINNNTIKEENYEINDKSQNNEIKKEFKNDINNINNINIKKKEDLRYKNMFDNEDIDDKNEKYENIEEENIIINKTRNNNIIDFDENVEEKNNYQKENKYEKDNKNKNIIQKLLDQMEFLTNGQNSLEKMFNNIQLDTQEQIENLNINFENLQAKTNRLNKAFDNYNLSVY